MEIEYKRELTKSYMCVKTDQDFLPFEKEILTRSSILSACLKVRENWISTERTLL